MQKNKNIQKNSNSTKNNNANTIKTTVTKAVRRAINGIREPNAVSGAAYFEPTRINHFRKYHGGNLLSELQIYNKHVRDRYLLGLVHPDIAVRNQIPVKMYSDVPIPTASVGFHDQFTLSTSANGTFLLSWVPNFLMTQPYLNAIGLTDYSCISYNNSAALTGAVGVAGNTYLTGSYIPNVDIQRYRLVSAVLQVQYNGEVLERAGTMLSSAVYDSMSVCLGSAANPVTNYSNTLADRYGAFQLIQNGLWNETVNVSKHAEGIECLWIPTDPDSMIFDRIGAYKGNTRSGAGTIAGSAEGAYINYVIAGRNLQPSKQCILVDVYYNYEVIADPSAAPFLRSSIDTVYDSKYNDEVKGVMSEAVRTGSLIKKMPEEKTTFAQAITSIAKQGLQYLPQILAML